MSNEYPAELFETTYAIAVNPNSMEALHRKLGYDLGKKYALADTGDWHNFTAAIKAGEPIDFEELLGKTILLTHKKGWRIEGYHLALKDAEQPASRVEHWAVYPSVNNDALINAWRGWTGWTLWIDGEIPMKKQTADELPFGTSFKDSHGHEYVVVAYGRVQALYGNCNVTPAKNIVVAEVFGMYGQKESE